MKADRREVTGLAAKPVILPSDQSKTTAFKLFYALKSTEENLGVTLHILRALPRFGHAYVLGCACSWKATSAAHSHPK